MSIRDFENEFKAALLNEKEKAGHGFQADLYRKTKVSRQYINDILNGRKAGGEENRRKIAMALGYAYEEFLDVGYALLAEEPPAEYVFQKPKEVVDIMTIGLTPEQVKSLQEYRDLLAEGGEGIEAISTAVSALASRKLSK